MPTMYYDMKKPVEKQQRIKGTISNFMRTDIHSVICVEELTVPEDLGKGSLRNLTLRLRLQEFLGIS